MSLNTLSPEGEVFHAEMPEEQAEQAHGICTGNRSRQAVRRKWTGASSLPQESTEQKTAHDSDLPSSRSDRSTTDACNLHHFGMWATPRHFH